MSEETKNIELKPTDALEPTAGSERETLSSEELDQVAGGRAYLKEGIHKPKWWQRGHLLIPHVTVMQLNTMQ